MAGRAAHPGEFSRYGGSSTIASRPAAGGGTAKVTAVESSARYTPLLYPVRRPMDPSSEDADAIRRQFWHRALIAVILSWSAAGTALLVMMC